MVSLTQIQEVPPKKSILLVGPPGAGKSTFCEQTVHARAPPLFYWHPDTLRLIKSIQRIRKEGLECYFTVDAGPNVHCLCRPEDTYELQKMLEKIECINRTILARPADDSFATKEHLF